MARSKPPSFDFFPEDFISGTIHLHPFCIGLYIRLLCYQWSHGRFPASNRELQQVTGATESELAEFMPAIYDKFPEVEKGVRLNVRLEQERLKKIGISQSRSEAAHKAWSTKRGANALHDEYASNTDASVLHDAKHMQREVGRRKKEEGSRKTEEGDGKEVSGGGVGEPSGSRYSEAFERFWSVYPSVRKTKKPDAWKAWSKAIKDVDVETIVAAAAEYAASPLGSGEFSSMPSSFLSARMWEDDRTAWQRSGKQLSAAQQRDANTDAAGEAFEAKWQGLNFGELQ